jgi:hypothetical protein
MDFYETGNPWPPNRQGFMILRQRNPDGEGVFAMETHIIVFLTQLLALWPR